MDDNIDHSYAPFWLHIEELRRTFLRVLIIIFSGVAVCFICYEPLIAFLASPLTNTRENLQTSPVHTPLEQVYVYNDQNFPQIVILPDEALTPANLSEEIERISSSSYSLQPGGSFIYAKKKPLIRPLIVLGPLEGILIALKTSFWAGSILTSPLWLLACMQFIAPALRTNEKRYILPFLITSLAFIIIGCSFAFLITIPLANNYLATFNQAIGTNFWSLSHYLDYTVFLLLANGLSFELCAIGIFAVQLGLISEEALSAKRRVAIVCAFILGALLTPPDILTQVMLAIPLILLYEGIILYARLVQHKSSQS